MDITPYKDIIITPSMKAWSIEIHTLEKYDATVEVIESDPHLLPVFKLVFYTADGYTRFYLEYM